MGENRSGPPCLSIQLVTLARAIHLGTPLDPYGGNDPIQQSLVRVFRLVVVTMTYLGEHEWDDWPRAQLESSVERFECRQSESGKIAFVDVKRGRDLIHISFVGLFIPPGRGSCFDLHVGDSLKQP